MQPFKITDKQKHQLSIMAKKLQKLDFNVHAFNFKVRKQLGYFPPIDTILKIGDSALKAKTTNPWAYFVKALKTELPLKFAELNVNEGRGLKGVGMASNVKDVLRNL